MPITLTITDIRNDINVDNSRAAQLLLSASAIVNRYANSDTPDGVLNEAALRCAGWLALQPFASVRRDDQGGVSTNYAPNLHSALRNSGGMALLSPFRKRRAGAI